MFILFQATSIAKVLELTLVSYWGQETFSPTDVLLLFAEDVVSKQEVFSDKVEPVELFSVEFVDVDNKLSMLDDEEKLKGRALTDFSTFMRAASILSHFLLLHFDLSFLEKKFIIEK